MTESNTRKWWRARLEGLALDILNLEKQGFSSDTDGWLDDLMQTPELALAELAESNPNYRLAVVDTSWAAITYDGGPSCHAVVKMEGK